MNRLVVDKDRCKACRLCIKTCTRSLLSLSDEMNSKGYHPVAIKEMEKCVACGLCATMCPEGAISVYKSQKKAS
jgi:2-oxoglutarate ferredoxin oxidoreductase subunit delta